MALQLLRVSQRAPVTQAIIFDMQRQREILAVASHQRVASNLVATLVGYEQENPEMEPYDIGCKSYEVEGSGSPEIHTYATALFHHHGADGLAVASGWHFRSIRDDAIMPWLTHYYRILRGAIVADLAVVVRALSRDTTSTRAAEQTKACGKLEDVGLSFLSGWRVGRIASNSVDSVRKALLPASANP